jgi:hypothetical protein
MSISSGFDSVRKMSGKSIYLFELSTYCSTMNLIEAFGHQIKLTYWLVESLRMNTTAEIAVIEGVETRAKQGQYIPERFLFNSA